MYHKKIVSLQRAYRDPAVTLDYEITEERIYLSTHSIKGTAAYDQEVAYLTDLHLRWFLGGHEHRAEDCDGPTGLKMVAGLSMSREDAQRYLVPLIEQGAVAPEPMVH